MASVRSHVRRVVALGLATGLLIAGEANANATWGPQHAIPGSEGRVPLFASFAGGDSPAVGVYGPLALFPRTPQAPVAISPDGAAAPTPLSQGLASPIALSAG